MPRVSVVMNCFNGARYLRQALDSVFAQTYTDWEVVFWDNASSDDSAAIAQSYGEKLRYFRASANTSLGEARNQAFAKCQGEYVSMLDVDDLWLPDKLARQVPLLDADPTVGLTYCGAMMFDDLGGERLFADFQPPCRGRCFAELLRRNFICSGTMLFRRSALAGLSPLFESDMTMIMDYFLTLRVAARWSLDYVPAPLVRYRIHPGSESSRKWHLFSAESSIMLERLVKDLPETVAEHAQVFEATRRGVDLQCALDAWAAGNIPAVRQAVRPHLGRGLLPTLIFLASWLYPWTLPLEGVRRVKHGLVTLLGKSRSPFCPHGTPDEHI